MQACVAAAFSVRRLALFFFFFFCLLANCWLRTLVCRLCSLATLCKSEAGGGVGGGGGVNDFRKLFFRRGLLRTFYQILAKVGEVRGCDIGTSEGVEVLYRRAVNFCCSGRK